jgi:uncharacterized C2H2 Zn-finger protein
MRCDSLFVDNVEFLRELNSAGMIFFKRGKYRHGKHISWLCTKKYLAGPAPLPMADSS